MTEPIPERVRWFKARIEGAYGDSDELEEPTEEQPANLVSSLCTDGLHRPALDIDIACELIPSATPGHFHLYFPELALTWERYHALLIALEAAFILEPGYVSASVEREQTVLRLPGATKWRPAPLCVGCDRRPEDISECVQMTAVELELDYPPSVEEVHAWVRENEGTYNAKNGHFLCDRCYIEAGQPSLPAPGRWVAP